MDFKDEAWRVKKYDKGKGLYNWHVDASNKDYAQRVLAVIFYLNDVEKGGETSIKLDGKIHNIKPEKGKLLIFPANVCYLHKGNVPESDNKYIMTTFLRFAN